MYIYICVYIYMYTIYTIILYIWNHQASSAHGIPSHFDRTHSHSYSHLEPCRDGFKIRSFGHRLQMSSTLAGRWSAPGSSYAFAICMWKIFNLPTALARHHFQGVIRQVALGEVDFLKRQRLLRMERQKNVAPNWLYTSNPKKDC